jgi:HJR/Mrr/RecB family endonuclease
MASGWQRNNRKKYAKATNDHVVFILIILLAAAVYAHQANGLIKQRNILDILRITIAVIGLALLLKLLRNLTRVHSTWHAPRAGINTMTGLEFERYIARLLPSQGYKHVELTEHYDFGFDIIAEKDGILWGIQVKRHSSPVKVAAVRQAVAALKHYDCDRAMVITNSDFSAPARELALSNNCVLINGQQLAHWQNVSHKIF